jgi:hypothetical protein
MAKLQVKQLMNKWQAQKPTWITAYSKISLLEKGA